MNILLHICCAPCGGNCVERLLNEGHHVKFYYSNCNINTQEEFDKRLYYVKMLAGIFHVEVEVDPYDHAAWRKYIAGYEAEPEHGLRCGKCFKFSLTRTAHRATELGWHFATTLTVSPRKCSKAIFDAASGFEHFLPYDFKKKDGYKRSCEIARQYGFYRQRYCACEFSLPPDQFVEASASRECGTVQVFGTSHLDRPQPAGLVGLAEKDIQSQSFACRIQ